MVLLLVLGWKARSLGSSRPLFRGNGLDDHAPAAVEWGGGAFDRLGDEHVNGGLVEGVGAVEADVADLLAAAAKEALRIGQRCPEEETERHPLWREHDGEDRLRGALGR